MKKNSTKGFIDFDTLQIIFSLFIIAIIAFSGLKLYQLYKEDRIIQTSLDEITNLANFYKQNFPEHKEKINFAEKTLKKFIRKNGSQMVKCIKEKDPIICIKSFNLVNNIPVENKEDLLKAIQTLENLKTKIQD